MVEEVQNIATDTLFVKEWIDNHDKRDHFTELFEEFIGNNI